jgi:hypothetical protein
MCWCGAVIVKFGSGLQTTIDMKVVEEASARHGYRFITVLTDHSGVCKPEDKTSNSYTRLLNLVKDVVGDNPSPQTNDEIIHERSELIYSKVMQRKNGHTPEWNSLNLSLC